jgi:hypothetical protein
MSIDHSTESSWLITWDVLVKALELYGIELSFSPADAESKKVILHAILKDAIEQELIKAIADVKDVEE